MLAIDQAAALNKFAYDPVTGVLANRKTGKPVGTPSLGHGYLQVWFGGKLYRGHRIIWTMVHGAIPEGMEIDHIDGVKSNNRIANLRLATCRQNRENIRTAIASNKHGLLGAYYHPHSGKWQAKIMANGKTYNLGYRDTAVEAHQLYVAAKRNLHSFCTI